jgi:hypothetical protein
MAKLLVWIWYYCLNSIPGKTKTARFCRAVCWFCYSPLPKRRDHHPARRGWLSFVAAGAGWAGAGAADGSDWP